MSDKPTTTFFSQLLTALHVRHTRAYSDMRFSTMPFLTMFGLSKLAGEYGIDTLGIRLGDKSEVVKLPVPFVAPVHGNVWVAVTGIDRQRGTVTYLSQGNTETAPAAVFSDAWNGTALLLSPDPQSCEPQYLRHRFAEVMTTLRNLGAILLTAALFVYAFMANGLYTSYATVLLVLFNLVGLTASVMLAQKSIGINTAAGERICSAIERAGCDHVVKSGGTFLGILHWSDVGLGYFGVSLIALLCFPQSLSGWLTLFNACCLPYSFWSVGYQKLVAKSWCTLCLIVQATLWILALSYLLAGGWHRLWGNVADGVILLAFYVLSVLVINLVLSWIKDRITDADDSGPGSSI